MDFRQKYVVCSSVAFLSAVLIYVRRRFGSEKR